MTSRCLSDSLLLACVAMVAIPAHAGDIPSSRTQHTAIMLEMLDDDGWAYQTTTRGGVEVYKKTMSGENLLAGMVRKVMDVPIEAIMEVLAHEERFAEFMGPVYLEEARILNANTSDYHDVYQYLDLPRILRDRHYVVRLFTERDLGGAKGKHRVWWTMLPADHYADVVAAESEEHSDPIYIAATEGCWEIDPLPGGELQLTYRLFTDPGGKVPDWAVGIGNRESMPDLLELTEAEARKRWAER